MANRLFKATCCLTIAAILCLSLPYQAARAKPVDTEAGPRPAATAAQADETANAAEAQLARERLRQLMMRAEARAQLEAYGVSRAEALARIDSLSDAEVARFARNLDEMPAGGTSASGLTAIFALVFAGVVMLAVLLFWGVKEAVEAASD